MSPGFASIQKPDLIPRAQGLLPARTLTPPLFLAPPGSLRSPPPPPQSAVFVFIAVRAHVALLPKGIVSLTPASRTPHTCSRHEPRGRGRGRPGCREPRRDGAQAASRALRGPAPLGAPFSKSPPPRRPSPRRLSRPPPCTPTPSRVPRPPRPPAPPAGALLCPAHCPGSRCWALGGQGAYAQGSWTPPAAHRSLGNAGKARAMLALRAGAQRLRGSPGGATAGEGGHRQQAGFATRGWREDSGRSHGKPSACAVPPNLLPSLLRLQSPQRGLGTRGSPRPPQPHRWVRQRSPQRPRGNRAREHFGDPVLGQGLGSEPQLCV